MAQQGTIAITDFKGLRNDRGQKFVSPEYFYDINNFNFDDIIGSNKILLPDITYDFGLQQSIDGIFDFKYLVNDQTVEETIVVTGGKVYKNILGTSPELIVDDLEIAKCDFSVLNNKLYIANGMNYLKVYNGTVISEQGAPIASESDQIGNPNGEYYYAMTFVTSGGEEYGGTVSNTLTVSNKKVSLELPIGYTGTLSRKIYRTVAGGSILKLLTTIADNSTLSYLDDTLDGSLGADIISVNSPFPKAKYVETAYRRIILTGDTSLPNYLWVGETNIDVIDPNVYEDISGAGNDGSPVMGISQDYSNLIVGTQSQIYVVDVSLDTPTVTLTRANVGVRDGYSMAKVPMNESFPGGVMFLSSMNDFRVFNGNFAQPVATSLDNLKTDNFSQVIRQSLIDALQNLTPNIFGYFYDYKYHCIIGNTIFFFDIRTQSWGKILIETESYSPSYNVMGELNGDFYWGQSSLSILEKAYTNETYRDEACSGFLRSPNLVVGEDVKYFKAISFFFATSENKTMDLRVIVDGDYNNPITAEIQMGDGAFDPQFFDSNDYDTNFNTEDYRIVYLNVLGRWIEYQISSDNAILFRGFKLDYDLISNKERA